VRKGRRFWRGFRLGWIFGAVFFTATLWWIQHVTLPGMLALCAYLALYPAVFLGVVSWLGLRGEESWGGLSVRVLVPAGAWGGLEWVRTVALSGFPWNGLGVPLFPSHGMRALSSVTGVTGLSMIVVVVSVLVGMIWRLSGKSRRAAGVFLGVAVVLGTVAEVRCALDDALILSKPATDGKVVHVLLVQPNVTMAEKLSPDPEVQRKRYFDLVAQTDEALARAAPKPDLVVWPESAVPGFFDEMVAGGAFKDQLAQGDITLVTGADHEEWGKLYNSVVAMRGTTENHVLHPKVRLVPFGEFIPFRKEIPIFETMLGGLIPMDFSRGTSLDPISLKGQNFSLAPLVCFEDTIGEHARKFVRAEPQVLVNVTNDNWFLQSPATEMHFANARWRAPELHRTLVRSANTGVSAMVSPEGMVWRVPSFTEAAFQVPVSPGSGTITFYAAHGDLITQVAGGLSLGGIGLILIRRRNREN
ncbi:MAG: apolipoprotein N-acyltransferase, partial [Verrucomicrobiales bacterium]|nr:apolipoprotein N-acyltransferase [Verrucomicrobiales bacterium]